MASVFTCGMEDLLFNGGRFVWNLAVSTLRRWYAARLGACQQTLRTWCGVREVYQMTEGRQCQVQLLDDRKLELLVQPKLLSRELLDLVASYFNLKEKEYFGITFVDDIGQHAWLQLDLRVLDHDLPKKPGPVTLSFVVRFYIESISFLKDSTTVELFFLNTKACVHKGTEAIILPQRDEATSDSPSTQDADLPTCLLCVCLSGSVYCEETEIDAIPPLPKETTYLYARFNKIKKITAKDFADIPSLRRIDLTGNEITEIEDGAFANLKFLEQLSLADNKLAKLPALPANLTSFNANNNKIKSKTIKANAFKKMNNLSYLYLAQNALESVPANLPESIRILHLQFNNITSITDDTFCKSDNTRYVRTKMDEIRMEGNPVILGKYPNSFTCLKMLPIGSYF